MNSSSKLYYSFLKNRISDYSHTKSDYLADLYTWTESEISTTILPLKSTLSFIDKRNFAIGGIIDTLLS